MNCSVGQALAAGRGLAAGAVLVALLLGVPWALLHHLGSPVPDRIPSLGDLYGALTEPLTDSAVVAVLTGVAWLLWASFVIDVVLAGTDLLRGRSRRDAGPIRRLATVLLTAMIVTLCARGAQGSPAQPHAPPPSGQSAFAIGLAVPAAEPYVVRPPVNGVHDSLWRIAERELGAGRRWPEIYHRNHGLPQPDGDRLTDPDLIQPGWLLQMPSPPAEPHPQPSPPPTATQPDAPPTADTTPPDAAPTADTPVQEPTSPRPSFEPPDDVATRSGVDEAFVGLGLAAAVGVALAVTRRRARRGYRPGSGRREDLAVSPVVYQLHLAAMQAKADLSATGNRPAHTQTRLIPEHAEPDSPCMLPVGVRDGQEVAFDLTAARGLGLVGAGADAAARALLLTAITTTPPALPLVTEAVLSQLCGSRVDLSRLPGRLRIVADLDDALDQLEAETVRRTREHSPADRPAAMLLAQPSDRHGRRLAAILDHGGPLGIAGILLGQWQPGTTAYVREDGTITAASPGLGQALRGVRMFCLANDHASDLMRLFHEAHAEHPEPASSSPPADTPIEITAHEPLDDVNPDPNRVADARRDSNRAPTAEPAEASKPVQLTVLGQPRISRRDDAGPGLTDITAAFQPRLRELLVFLALHPDGTSRHGLIAALWPGNPPASTTNALNTTLSRLRRAVESATHGGLNDLLVTGDGSYRLDRDLVDVDYWHFANALSARRAADNEADRVAANRQILQHYRGPLADGLETEWLEPAREAARRDAIDAVAALARARVDADPEQTLDLLEAARTFDPHNELLYRDIMRLQRRLGRLDAIPRTLNLLRAHLAELDEQPTEQTLELAAGLCSPRTKSTA